MSDLKTALILDSRIENLTDVESFGVKSSGQNITFQQYQALSATSSLITFQTQIPSESILVDRHFRIRSTMTFQINIDSMQNVNGDGTDVPIPVGSNVWNWGTTEAFAPFCLTQSLSTMQASINNASVSINIGDVLPQMLRMTSQRELQKYNSSTPAYPDSYFGNYSDAAQNYVLGATSTRVNAVGNPLGGSMYAPLDNDFVGRGAFPTSVKVFRYLANGAYRDHSPIAAEAAGNKFKIIVSATFTEPLMLSPFLNCMPHGNSAGFLGINTLTLNLNVNNLQRCLRTAQQQILTGNKGMENKYNWVLTGGNSAISAADGGGADASQLFTNTQLLCQFITLNPSQSSKIALRNICEFTDTPRFISQSNANVALPAAVVDPVSGVITPSRDTITTNNLQLNQIPSRFVIVIRPDLSQQSQSYADAWCAIENISINFNNKSGILASCPVQQLWSDISVKGGSTQTWQEFAGYAQTNVVSNGVATATETVPQTYTVKQIPTIGSMLVIDSTDLGLTDEVCPGSLGQYNFQCNIRVANYQSYAILNPEVCIMVFNEGLFSTVAGSSSIMTGLINKQLCLSAKEQEPAADSESYRRFVGGVLSNSSLANASQLLKKYYKKLPVPLMHAIQGSGMSGGASSGGRRHLSRHFV